MAIIYNKVRVFQQFVSKRVRQVQKFEENKESEMKQNIKVVEPSHTKKELWFSLILFLKE